MEKRYNGKCKGCGAKFSTLAVRVQYASRPPGPGDVLVEFVAAGCAYLASSADDYALRYYCRTCRRWNRAEAVRGVMNAGKRCDARCMNAIGHDCECACGGKGHGAGWTAAPPVAVSAVPKIVSTPLTPPKVSDTVSNMEKATFTKLKSGDWGVRVEGEAMAGQVVTAIRKDGSTSPQTIEKVIWTDGKVSLCAIAPQARSASGGSNAGRARGGGCHTDGNCSSCCNPRTCPCGDGSWFRCC